MYLDNCMEDFFSVICPSESHFWVMTPFRPLVSHTAFKTETVQTYETLAVQHASNGATNQKQNPH